MEGESDMNKMDDVMLPGFRFHPTDEELVGFYLKRKIQHRTLPIELIKQVDIYKYDPWDLPKLACSGEKEWYFYCPRDRKYRNSVRPNRVTVAGFWKATGTDRPIYSSNGTECIGLKKSLVFYRGRAAKGLKTDWMMHEFRLPSSTTTTTTPKNVSDKNLPPNDLWAICRIFKKTNSMAQRALSRSWISHIHDTTPSSDHILNQNAHYNLFSPDPISDTTETGSPIQISRDTQIICNNNANHSDLDQSTYKPIINSTLLKSYIFPFSTKYLSPTTDAFSLAPTLVNEDVGKISENVDFQGQQPIDDEQIFNLGKNLGTEYSNNDWGAGFPYSLPSNILDVWKTDFTWDSPTCPSDISATFSTT